MSKKVLAFDVVDHLDFSLIGIICAFKDYKLCFEINQLLEIELARIDDLELHLERKGSTGLFPLYHYKNNDDESFFLIANKGNHTWLIPEQKHIDFYLLLRNCSPFTNIEQLIKSLKKIKIINSVIPVTPSTLKSADHFLYIDEEKKSGTG